MFGTDSHRSLKAALEAAQTRVEKAVAALAPKHKGGEIEEFEAARSDLLTAERALAAALGQPHAVPVDFPVQWSTGAPLPHLLQNDDRAFLVFFIHHDDPNWDGTYTNIRRASQPDASNVAIVEFKGCVSAKLGGPNDEVLHGHPAYGKGLEGYSALKIENSPWLSELESINSVHDRYDSSAWRNLSHFFLGFHDSTVECIATSLIVEHRVASLPDALSEVCSRLIE